MVPWQRMLRLRVCVTCLLANYVTQTCHNQEASYRVDEITRPPNVQGALRTSKYLTSAITSKATMEIPHQHVLWCRQSTGVRASTGTSGGSVLVKTFES